MEKEVQIGGAKRDNGLYLGKFETKEEAIDYVEMLSRKYKYTRNRKNMSIRKLCRYAKNEGVIIYPKTLSEWFKSMGIEIRTVRPKPKATKKSQTYTIDKDVIEYLDDYDNKSYMAELGLKILMRLPTDDIVLFLPAEAHEEPINIIFQKISNNKIKAVATGKLNERDKAMISGMIQRAEKKGMKHIVDFARLFGYKWYGGNNEKTERES